jgi:serine protease
MASDRAAISAFAERVRRVRSLLVAPRPSSAGDGGLEATARPASLKQRPHPDDLLDRLNGIAERMPADEVPDQVAFRQALTTLLEYGDSALRRLARPPKHPDQGLDGDQLASLEAIVIADGSRPSFLLRDGRVPTDHPFLGDWRDAVTGHADALQVLAAAVGRIEPGQGHASQYIGTGTLIDRTAGLVLTNYHVLDEARERHGIAMEQSGTTVRVLGDLMIDFAGETTTLTSNRFRVVEARLPLGAGRKPGELDAAVLRIEPLDSQSSIWPSQAARLSADPAYALGASRTLCTIGFPGAPQKISPPNAQVDWDFVVSTLFGNRFGFKRLAPGQFMAGPGSVPADTAKRVLTHDATTFGGTSGSLLFAWEDAGTPGFALHFSGKTGDSNQAVSLARAASELRDVDVLLT